MTHPADSALFASADLRTVSCACCGADRDPRSLDGARLCADCARAAEVTAARACGELGGLLSSPLDPPEVAEEIRRAAADEAFEAA